QFALVIGEDGRQVDRGDGVEEEIDQVVFWQPVLRRRGEQIRLIGGPVSIGLVHRRISPHRVTGCQGPPDYSNPTFGRQYSDRLLDVDLSRAGRSVGFAVVYRIPRDRFPKAVVLLAPQTARRGG